MKKLKIFCGSRTKSYLQRVMPTLVAIVWLTVMTAFLAFELTERPGF